MERNSGLSKSTPGCSAESDIVPNHCRGATRPQPSQSGRLDGPGPSAHCPIAATDWRSAPAGASPRPPPTSGRSIDPADVRQSGLYKDKSQSPSTTLHEGLSPNSQPQPPSLNSEVEHHHRSSSPMAPKLLPRQPSPQQQKQQQQQLQQQKKKKKQQQQQQQQQQPSPSPPLQRPPPPQAPLSQQITNVKHRRTQSVDLVGKTSATDRLRTSSASAINTNGSRASAAAAATAADAGAVGGSAAAAAAATSPPTRNGLPQPLSRPGSARASPIRMHVASQRQPPLVLSPSTPAHCVNPSVSSLHLSLTRALQAPPVPSAQVVPPVAAPVPHMAAPPMSPPLMSSMQTESLSAVKVLPSQLVPKSVTETASSAFFQPPTSQAKLESGSEPPSLPSGTSVPPPAPAPASLVSSTSSSSSSLSSMSPAASSPSTSPSTSPATSATLPPVPSQSPPATESLLQATCFGSKSQGNSTSASSLGPSKTDAVHHATTSSSPLDAMAESPSSVGVHKNGDDGGSAEVTSESIEYYKQNSHCINWQDVHELCASMDIAGMRIEEVYIQCLPPTKQIAVGEDFQAVETQQGSALASAAARKLQPEEVLMALKFQNMTLMHYPGDHNTKQRFHEVYINQ